MLSPLGDFAEGGNRALTISVLADAARSAFLCPPSQPKVQASSIVAPHFEGRHMTNDYGLAVFVLFALSLWMAVSTILS
jgi:hypothetical protein